MKPSLSLPVLRKSMFDKFKELSDELGFDFYRKRISQTATEEEEKRKKKLKLKLKSNKKFPIAPLNFFYVAIRLRFHVVCFLLLSVNESSV